MKIIPGFNAVEATELLRICTLVNGTVVAGDPKPSPPIQFPPSLPPVPPPANWSKYYAPERSMPPAENYFEIWRNNSNSNQFAICFRGTIDAVGSILEDGVLLMIPAEVKFSFRGTAHQVRLAEDSDAHVHAGFTGGLAVLLPEVLLQLELILGISPDPELYVIGHSQGAALATLFRSFLHYQPLFTLNPVKSKTYIFAQPKTGNDHYAYDFDQINFNNESIDSLAFRLTNTQDWVPQVPLTIELFSDVNQPNFLTTKSFLSKNKIIAAIVKWLLGFQAFTTLNYLGCGTNVILRGIKGANPDDPNDFFWQHHARHYYKLLTDQFPT